MQTNKFDYAMAMSVARCFNVAAICALAIWHGYAFYLNQAIARSPASQTIELKLQETPAAVIAKNSI